MESTCRLVLRTSSVLILGAIIVGSIGCITLDPGGMKGPKERNARATASHRLPESVSERNGVKISLGWVSQKNVSPHGRGHTDWRIQAPVTIKSTRAIEIGREDIVMKLPDGTAIEDPVIFADDGKCEIGHWEHPCPTLDSMAIDPSKEFRGTLRFDSPDEWQEGRYTVIVAIGRSKARVHYFTRRSGVWVK